MVNQTTIDDAALDLRDRLRAIRSYASSLALAYPQHCKLCWRIYFSSALGHFASDDDD